MAQALLLLNHLLHFFIMPLAWAALFCLGTQLLCASLVRQSGRSWRQRFGMAAAGTCLATLLMLPLNGGQSSMAYYGLLAAVLLGSEAWQLKIWRA